MSFWNGETLAQELPALIVGFDPSRIDGAAYTLRMGAEVYVSPSNGQEAAATTKKALAEKESFVIPPGQFAFLLTEERVRVPPTALGFISMKARIKFRGLVNVSGFHVDPGYEGNLVFAVFNAGPSGVHLARGDDCFLIWYASLNATSKSVREGRSFSGIPSDLINPIAGEVQSLANLDSRIRKVESEHQLLRVGAAALLAIALPLLVRNCQQQGVQPNVQQIVNPAPSPASAAPRTPDKALMPPPAPPPRTQPTPPSTVQPAPPPRPLPTPPPH